MEPPVPLEKWCYLKTLQAEVSLVPPEPPEVPEKWSYNKTLQTPVSLVPPVPPEVPEKWSYHKTLQRCRSFLVLHKVEIITSVTDILVSHPFVLLRRQCQVQAELQTYHLTPISLVPVVFTIVQRQGVKVLFKGMLSVVLLNVCRFAVEKALSKTTRWPCDLPPTWYVNRDWLNHFFLKTLSFALTFPLYSRSVLHTVAVGGASDPNEGFIRRHDFALPFWQTMWPSVACDVFKYAFRQAVSSVSAALLYLNLCFDERGYKACRVVEGGIAIEDRQDITLTASVVSHFSAEIMFYPLETIANRLIVQGCQVFSNDLDCGLTTVRISSAYDGFFDCYDHVLWLEGKLGLYKGLGALFMQAIIYHYSIKLVNCTWRSARLFKRSFYSA